MPSPAPDSRQGVAAATDGTDFFVVWADERTPGRGAIMGTRLKRTGQVLDPFGIRITSVPAGTGWPTAVWDGAADVVVWTQGKNFGETLQRDQVWATRVDRDGRILTEPRVISEGGMQATTTSGAYAASNGSVTVVAYRNFHFSGAVRIAVLDRDGNVIRREGLENRSPDLSRGISVAATSTRFVVTWATNDLKVFASSLTSEGSALQRPVQIGAGEDPAVATDGASVTMVWRRWTPELSKVVLMSRTADAELGRVGDVQTLASEHIIEWPSLLWRGGLFEVIAGHQTYTQTRLNPVAYKHPDSYRTQIVARLYRGSSPELDVQQLLSWSANAHERPAIASSESGHFAAWMENQSVYATRIDANGNSLDGRGVELTKAGFAVRAAFDGTNYVVAWIDNGFIGVRSNAPITGATVAEVYVPALAWAWESFALEVSPDAAYLAWVDGAEHRVRATRISLASGTVDLPLAVSPEGMIAGYPAIAWSGSMLLVAWNELREPSGNIPARPALNVLAARVSSGLSLLDPAPMTVATGGASLLGRAAQQQCRKARQRRRSARALRPP